jgi:peptidoglycan-associated lipoprotein
MSGRIAGVFVIALVVVFSVAGCQQKRVTTQDAVQQEKQQQSMDEQKKGQEVVVAEKQSSSVIESVDAKDKEAQYAESKENPFSDILFDFDKYDVKDSYKTLLLSVTAWMTKNGTARLTIEGHCDERGTNEYNLALGDRRAKAVKDYLIGLGIASGRVDLISYGEEKALCNEQNEDCWAKNRRAHFVLLHRVGR